MIDEMGTERELPKERCLGCGYLHYLAQLSLGYCRACIKELTR